MMDEGAHKKVVAHLAAKYRLHPYVVQEIADSQFDLLRKVMESCDKRKGVFPSIRLFRLGRFYVSGPKQRRYADLYGKQEGGV